jgi:multidrug efflux pump subunit AcrA (membrane-fusion protein)
MKSKKYRVAPFLVLAALITAGCSRQKQAEDVSPEPENTAAISMNQEAVSAGGLRIETVSRRRLLFPFEATGVVSFNPRVRVQISARTSGRIEKINCFPGDRASAGQELIVLYSPEFLIAQAELLQINERLRLAGSADEKDAADRLFRSAIRRLEVLGLTRSEIDSVIRTGEPRPSLSVRAPFSGSILKSAGIAGGHVESGAELMEMADLSSLWVMADIYEASLASLQKGASAEIRTAAYPNEIFRGMLTNLGDVVEESTRTVKARVEIRNAYRKLKPGMFVNIKFIPSGTARTLAVPEKAVRNIEGGEFVFVEHPKGSFSKRKIETGGKSEGWAEVLSGLKEGERIVSDGSFIVKSEFLKSDMEGE